MKKLFFITYADYYDHYNTMIVEADDQIEALELAKIENEQNEATCGVAENYKCTEINITGKSEVKVLFF
jgi:hypothetical protein